MTKLYFERMACCMSSIRYITLATILWCCSTLITINTNAQCNNITWGGEICCDQSGIGPFDPALIYNTVSPSGGSGDIQFLWLAKNATSGWNWFTVYEGSNDCFDPTSICETTIYRRCSRRSGCSAWDGESNEVTIQVAGGCDPCQNYAGSPALENRVSSGLISLYSFETGAGNIVEDISGVGSPMNLQIENPGNITWLPNSGLSIHSPTIIKTPTAATKLFDALQGANAFTFEAWIKPESDAQGGPARIATMSSSTSQRNFMLGQNNDRYLMRLRTNNGSGDNNGLPNLNSPSNAVRDDFAQHIVYTMTSSGVEKMYLNGDLIATGNRSGGFTNWSSTMLFALGNEMTMDRSWLGRMYLVALYNQELDETEVQQNYAAAYPGYCSLTCNAAIHQLVVNNTDASAPAFILNDGATYDIDEFPSNWNVEALLLGDESESVKFTWSGAISQTNTENVYPFRSFGGDNNPINLGLGTYTILAEVFSQDGAVGIPCNTEEITFTIEDEIPCVNSVSVCEISQADAGHAVWFNGSLASAIGCSNNNFIPSSTCLLTKYSDGTLKVEGTVRNASNATKKFTFVTWYKLQRNWDAWSAIPHPTAPSGFREAKVDAGTTITITNEYLNWDYYELDESKPHSIVGIEGLAGLNLTVTHRPEDLRYGAQYGEKASLQSEGTGFSAWVNLVGSYNSTPLNDHGDYNFDINNCADGIEFSVSLSNVVQPDCENQCSGAATVNAIGGTESYSYAWSTGSTSASVSGLCSGIYTCVVTSGGCSQTLTLTITSPSCVASLGNFVWYDTDWDGIQDANESGASEINVSLYQCGGELISTQQTDENGYYLFENLIPGNAYNIVFSNLPEGYFFTSTNSGIDETIDSDASLGSGQTACVTLGSNENYPDLDAGIVSCPQPQLLGDAPLNSTIECGDPLPVIPFVQFIDPLNGNLDVEFLEVFESDNCQGKYIRTWTATNPCGMTASVIQEIDVIDNSAPILYGVPENASIDCDEPVQDAVVFAVDNCGGEPIVSLQVETNEDGCGHIMTRTWHTTDDCGNETSATQIIYIQDHTPPQLIGIPSDTSVECDAIPLPAEVGFTDNCDPTIEVQFGEAFTNIGYCGYDIVRTWTATDDCGNESSASQIISVSDTQNPFVVSSNAEEMTITCNQSPPDSEVVFGDACDDELSVQYFTGISNQSNCGYTIERTWIATDNCGNAAEVFQIIHVIDNLPPTLLDVPADVVVACGDIPPAQELSATDLCDEQVEVSMIESTENLPCGFMLIRTWTATDDCGNSSTAEQHITVADIIAPQAIYIPEDATYECTDIVPAWVPVFTDNCDTQLNIALFSDTSQVGCAMVVTRTWTATDNCGNSVQATHSIAITDSTGPVLSGVPENMIAVCTAVPPVSTVSASDNCDLQPDVYFSEETGVGCPIVITRTWIAVDDCGIETTAIQYITLIDTTPPIFAAPDDITVDCSDIPQAPDLIAQDDCSGEVSLEFIQSESNFTVCGYEIARTWIATDACGNSFSDTQIIMVTDFTQPNILNVPANVTVNCGEIPAWPIVFAEDFCSQVEITTNEIMESYCPMLITRTWTATDACGNSTVATQEILVMDDIAPVLQNIPDDLTLECDQEIPAFSMDVTATDNCDDMVSMNVYDDVIALECGYQINRTYVAEDNCGNESYAIQIIMVIDETAPVFEEIPGDITVSCDNIPVPFELVATDNCDEDLEYTFSESITGGGCQVQIKRIWTAIDDCGNAAIATQVLTIADNTDPEFLPFDVFVQISCDQLDEYILPAIDNCDDEVEVTVVEELLFSGACYGTIQRTFEAVDNCGNTTIAVQLIDIIDTIPPVLYNLPMDTIIQCSELPLQLPALYATDNCAENLVVLFSETQSQAFCPYILTRTWTVEDDCGNTTSYSQQVEVKRYLPPTVFLNTFPNPSSGGTLRIQLSIPETGEVNARLFDVTGKETKILMNGMAESNTLYDWQLNTNDMGSGSYTLKVVVDGAVYTERVTIVNN
ncbi:MAG: SdrD B-like domain-containing protein [Flavobacteriales bacterium]